MEEDKAAYRTEQRVQSKKEQKTEKRREGKDCEGVSIRLGFRPGVEEPEKSWIMMYIGILTETPKCVQKMYQTKERKTWLGKEMRVGTPGGKVSDFSGAGEEDERRLRLEQRIEQRVITKLNTNWRIYAVYNWSSTVTKGGIGRGTADNGAERAGQ